MTRTTQRVCTSRRIGTWLRAGGLAVSLVFVTVAVAVAHETWLLSATVRVQPGHSVVLDLTSGMAFPTPDYAIAPDRLARAEARLAGATAPLGVARRGAHALRLQWTPRVAGVALLSVQLAPRRLELDEAKVAEYLDEIGAPDSLRAAWATMPAPRRWREEYVKHATTFVRVGGLPAADSSWRTPAGLGLEIVPERDPTALRTGDTLTVRVLRRGLPLPGFVVGIVSARPSERGVPSLAPAAHRERFVRTDAAGRAALVLPSAGRWLLHGTDLRRVHDNPDLAWRSDFSTVTLAVMTRAAAP